MGSGAVYWEGQAGIHGALVVDVLSWRLLGDGEGQGEAGKGVWGASGRSVQGEKMWHMLLAL